MRGYVVEMIHEGTDVALRASDENDEEDIVFEVYAEAVAAARRISREMRCRMYVFTNEG